LADNKGNFILKVMISKDYNYKGTLTIKARYFRDQTEEIYLNPENNFEIEQLQI